MHRNNLIKYLNDSLVSIAQLRVASIRLWDSSLTPREQEFVELCTALLIEPKDSIEEISTTKDVSDLQHATLNAKIVLCPSGTSEFRCHELRAAFGELPGTITSVEALNANHEARIMSAMVCMGTAGEPPYNEPLSKGHIDGIGDFINILREIELPDVPQVKATRTRKRELYIRAEWTKKIFCAQESAVCTTLKRELKASRFSDEWTS